MLFEIVIPLTRESGESGIPIELQNAKKLILKATGTLLAGAN